MKELKKMSLANIQGSLSKEEMKQIMAGSGGSGCSSSGGRCIGSVGEWEGSCCVPRDCIAYCSSGRCECKN